MLFYSIAKENKHVFICVQLSTRLFSKIEIAKEKYLFTYFIFDKVSITTSK